MTFVLALANNDYLVQLSDRRLTRNGALVEDESNKAGHFYCDDAQMLYGYCGIAAWNEFQTGAWILDALRGGCGQERTLRGVLSGFAREATATFQSNPALARVPAGTRRLSVQFTGYLSDGQLVCVLVTNYQDVVSGVDSESAWDQFRSYVETLKRSPSQPYSFIQRLGAWKAMTKDDENVLRDMLVARVPRQAVLEKGVDLIREIADRPTAQGLIGKQINSASLVPKTVGPIAGYHSTFPTNKLHVIDQSDLRSGRSELQISGLSFSAEGVPIVIPKARRNHPCPCGSGKKYRHCHGRR